MRKILFILTVLSLFGVNVFAQKTIYKTGNVIQISQNDTLTSDLISASRFLNINGYISGDAYSASREFTLNGRVKDDIIVVGQDLQLNGVVGDKFIGVAGDIIITGNVEGDVIVFAGNVIIKPSAHIHGNLFVGSGNLDFQGGHIDGWIRGGSDQTYLNGNVGKYVDLSAGDIKFGTSYKSTGGTHLKLYKEVNTQNIPNAPSNLIITIEHESQFIKPVFLLWSLFAMFVTGLVLLLLFENTFDRLITETGKHLFRNTGIGLLAIIIIPLLFIAFLLLLFTIPIAFILIFLYLITLYFSWIITALYLGKYLISNFKPESDITHLYWSLGIGSIIVFFLTNLPYLGWIFSILFLAFGTGSILAYIWNNRYRTE
ncbi:MAG TPA: polymer-forming cytoskeletal protein [Balneolales bacterium]|nr:polymer-forming cytoskeletal protein [Balneolales bacterium]